MTVAGNLWMIPETGLMISGEFRRTSVGVKMRVKMGVKNDLLSLIGHHEAGVLPIPLKSQGNLACPRRPPKMASK